MASSLDWIMRPALEGLCSVRDLHDGTFDLADVDEMNEALDVRAENSHRIQEAQSRGR